jgi:hypothetical protein
MPGYRSSSEEFYISRDLQHILIRKANELKGERNRIELRICYCAAGIWKDVEEYLANESKEIVNFCMFSPHCRYVWSHLQTESIRGLLEE